MNMRSWFAQGAVLMWFFCSAHGQQQKDASAAREKLEEQDGAVVTLPLILTPKIPSPADIEKAREPSFRSATETSNDAPPEDPGFTSLTTETPTMPISDHDADKARDVGQDLLRKKLGLDPPSVQSTVTEGLSAGSKKLGSTVSSDFLEHTLPTLITSELFESILNGGSLLLDSEPTADPSADAPSPATAAQMALLNVLTISAGGSSPFADVSVSQACNRLQNTYARTRFSLKAMQQNQVQSVIDWCNTRPTGINYKSPISIASQPRVQGAPAPLPQPRAGSGSGGCIPGAKSCK